MSKRTKALTLVFVFVLVLITALSLYLQNSDSINSVRIVMRNEDGVTESIALFKRADKYYAFLPSFADLHNISIESKSRYRVAINDHIYKKDDTLEGVVTDVDNDIKLLDAFGISVCESKLVIQRSSEIPSLYIQLSNGTMKQINSDKNISKDGIIQAIDSQGTGDYLGSFKEFHGRGNSSWLGAKKPYSIEFENDTSLFGMRKGKKYNLLSNGGDLRHKIALDMALRSNVKYPLHSEFVDLYVNNEYYGLYLLTEGIEIGDERLSVADLSYETQQLNMLSLKQYPTFEAKYGESKIKGRSIPESPSNISGGYVFEMDYPSRGYDDHDSVVVTDSSICYNIWSPKYSSYDETMYALNYMNRKEQEFRSNGIDKAIDINSFVDYYLIQELLANTDDASFYFYKEKDDDLLYAGPIWDFDLALYESIYEIYVDPAASIKSISDTTIFHLLCDNPVFMSKVKERFKDYYYNELERIYTDQISEYSERVKSSYRMDFYRWNNTETSDRQIDFSREENVNSICEFLRERNEAFYKKWVGGQPKSTVQLLSSSGVNMRKYLAVDYGEALDEPEPQSEGNRFLGFYNNKTNEKLDLSKPIYSDGVYTARWEPSDDLSGTSFVKKDFSIRGIVKKLIGEETILIVGFLLIVILIAIFVGSDILHRKKGRRNKNE